MSDKQFFNNLSATYADVRRLDAKKINLKGKNILEYIKEATPTIKHSQDTRETVTENDLWGQYVETLEDGTAIVHDDYLSNPNDYNTTWLVNVKAVQKNKAYSEVTTDSDGKFTGVIEDSVVANIQTERIKDGHSMFRGTSLTSFNGDLSSLVNGYYMFYSTPLTSFSGDLSSLISSSSMFYKSSLTSFSGDLSSLVDGGAMFSTTPLTSFSSGDLSRLIHAQIMFRETSLTSFSGDLCNLIYGGGMFQNTPLTSFSGDLSSLASGLNMFYKTSLNPQSVMYIVESIRNLTEEKAKYTNGEIPWVTRTTDATTGQYIYSAPFGFMKDGDYIYTYNNPNLYTARIPSTSVGKLDLGINVTNNSSTIKQQLEDFAKEATYDSWEELKQEFVNKGWTVIFQYGGTETKITYDLRNGEQIIPCQIFAKLVEADKDSAEYCTEDASTFYNIEWGHDVTDTSSYTQFDSLEDAMASWNVFPKENIITTEE